MKKILLFIGFLFIGFILCRSIYLIEKIHQDLSNFNSYLENESDSIIFDKEDNRKLLL